MTVEAYTVMHDRDGEPELGIVAVLTRRANARGDDALESHVLPPSAGRRAAGAAASIAEDGTLALCGYRRAPYDLWSTVDSRPWSSGPCRREAFVWPAPPPTAWTLAGGEGLVGAPRRRLHRRPATSRTTAGDGAAGRASR